MNTDFETAPRARIVCICSDDKSLSELTKPFRNAGFLLESADTARNADVAVIDLRGQSITSKKAISIAALLRRRSPECSLFFIVDPKLESSDRGALRRHGETISIGDSAAPLIERCREIIRLRNIAEETGERLKSLAALNRLVEFPPIATSNSAPRVLVAGDPGPDALSAINAVASVAENCVCVLTVGQAMRAIDHQIFDCAIFIPSAENDPLFSLARALRRHPKHSTLPILFSAKNTNEAALYTAKGAKEFIPSAHMATDLPGKIQRLTRRARLMRTMRSFLNACNGESVRDGQSGAFTSTFLTEHGARLFARADQTDRPMSLVVAHLNMRDEEGEAEPGRRALHQATRLMRRVTRAEDIVARISPETFLIMLPATNEDCAELVSLRIKGVLENSVFRGSEESALYGAVLRATAFTRLQGMCMEETIAMALKKLNTINEDAATAPPQRFPK